MVQTVALGPQRFRIGKLDFTRISAEAGAIAINGAALLLLLAPLSMYVPPVEQPASPTIYQVIQRKLPPPPIPTPVPVTRTTTPPAPAIQQKIEVPPQPPVFDRPQVGDIAADPIQLAKVDPGLGRTITQPMAGAHLEYAVAPPPSYPAEAVRNGLTGTVMLRVLVGVDGKPIDVQIERSSGHRILDAAAKRQVLAKWRFRPATQDGHAVQAIGVIPVEFNLYQ